MKEFFALPKQIQMREGLKFFSIMLGAAVFPYMAIYFFQYFGAFWTGMLLMITQVAGFFASLYGGHLADSWGRKKVSDLGNFGVLIGYILMTMANSPIQTMPILTYLGLLIAEVMSNFSQPAFDAMIIDLTDMTNRRFVYTMSYWLINISVMLGAGIAGVFYDHHFFQLLVGMSLIALVTFLIMYFKFGETKPKHLKFQHGAGILSTFKNYGQVLEDRTFLLYTLGMLLSSAVWKQLDNYIPVHFKEHFMKVPFFGQELTGAKMLSLAILVNTVMIVLLMTTVNRWTEKMKLIPQYLLGAGLFSTGLFFTMVFNSVWPILIMVFLYTIGEMIMIPAGQVLRAEMMDEDKVGSYSGFLSMTNPLGTILASFMLSLSYFTGKTGVLTLFVLIAASSMILIVKSAHSRKKVF